MRLRKFKTDSFAGLSQRKVEFTSGLNVLLGPNEAGKSTIIEAIYHTIFKNSRLNRTRTEDREFFERFMPYPGGNYIHGCLIFAVDDLEYKIEKEWGENPSVYLVLPDGQKVTGNKKVEGILTEIFEYGEGTYGNIVFTRQRDVKSAIERITDNNQVTGTISSFLRRAVMELDGISVEQLRRRIDDEINDLLKRWDYHNMRPENTDRGVHNPYTQGCGRVYNAYISREKTRLEMEKALEVEKEYERVSGELKELKDRQGEIASRLEKLSGLEGDIIKRGQLEPRIENLSEKIEELKGINLKWPVLESKLGEREEELREKEKELQSLNGEKEQSRKLAEKEQLDERLDRITERKKAASELREELEKLPGVTEDDLKKLSQLREKIYTARAAIEAATLVGRIRAAAAPVVITRGLKEKEEFTRGEKFTAEGYLRIQSGELDLEIQSGEIDFNSLEEEYREAREGLAALQRQLGVADYEEARNSCRRRQEIERSIFSREEQIREILAGEDLTVLKERAVGLAGVDRARPLSAVEAESQEVSQKIQDLKIEINTIKNTLQEWQEKYSDHNSLFDRIIEIKAEINELTGEMAGLAGLPEGFASAEGFNSHLAALREKAGELGERYNEKREEMFAVKENLPGVSYEELTTVYEEAAREYEKLVKKAGSMLRIKEVFEAKLEEMDRDSFRPLIESFSKYLSRLTAGNYDLGMIGDDFRIEVLSTGRDEAGESGNAGTVREKSLPANIKLLSFGTYDGVALALRFALLEQLFKEREGFIVLDDCLVNLDPARKEEAVNLINTFARENQVIFTTCNPATARELGGKVIEL